MTLLPLGSSNLPIVILGLIVLAGLVLLVRGIRGGAQLSHPTCGCCKYDLRGRDLAATASCPECGRLLSEPRGVKFGAYRRRPRLIVVGSLMLLAPIIFVMAVSAVTVRQGIRAGPIGLGTQTTAQIIQALPQTANRPQTWNELLTRHSRGELSEGQIAAAIDHVIAHLKTRSRHTSGWRCNNFVSSVVEANRVSPQQFARLCEASYGGDPNILMRTKLRSGQSFRFHVETGALNSVPGINVIACLTAIRVDGQALTFSDSYGTRQPLCGSWTLPGKAVMNVPPGDHTLEAEIEVGVIDEMQHGFEHGSRPTPDLWPQTISRWTKRVNLPITVLPADQSPVQLVRDETLASIIREGIRINRLSATERGSSTTIHATLCFDKKPLVTLSFEVLVKLQDQEVRLGRFSESNGSSRMLIRHATVEFEIPETVDKATIVLRPDVEEVESSYGTDYIWGEPIVFKDVPLVRESEPKRRVVPVTATPGR